MSSLTLPINSLANYILQLPAETAVLIRAAHGIGKSTVAHDLGAMLTERDGVEYAVLDRRLSQMQGGDLLGMPAPGATDRTTWLPPDWFMYVCERPCVLLLDEINRAMPDVLNSAFELVLDRRLAGKKIHPLTRIISGVNTGGLYDVRQMDPALLDRFWVVDATTNAQIWAAYAREKNLPETVIDWVVANEQYLMPPIGNYDPSSKHPSPRSVERAARAVAHLVVNAPYDPDAAMNIYTIAAGYLGVEAAASLKEHCRTRMTVTGADVLQRWTIVRKKVDLQRVELLSELLIKLSEEVLTWHTAGQKTEGDKVDETLKKLQQDNIMQFLYDCPPDLRPKFFQELAKKGTSRIDLIMSFHYALAKPILDGVGVPMGAAGVGIAPKLYGLDGKTGT